MWDFFASDMGKVALGGLIAISGQLLVFLLGWAKESRVSRKKRTSDAQHLGIRIVLALEKLLVDCVRAVNDPTFTDNEGYTRSMVPNPDFTLPQEGDYRSLPTGLMYEIMSLPNKLDAIKEGMSAAYEYADPPEYESYYLYRDEHLSKLGLQVLPLIESLCDKYKIPMPERSDYYDPRQNLLGHLARIADFYEKRQNAQEKMLESIESEKE